MTRRAALAGLLVSLVLPAQAAAGGRAADPPAFGVNAQFLTDRDDRFVPPSSWGLHLRPMAHARIELARTVASWQQIEPSPPRGGRRAYRWHAHDRVVRELARRRLRWFPVIAYSADWAAATPFSRFSAPRPEAYPDYAALAGAIARRYGRGGSFWRRNSGLPRLPVRAYEIWNAPSEDVTWAPGADPRAYGGLYLAARSAIRGVDHRADVIVGGLGPSGPDFVSAMLEARPALRGNIDAVGLHPYADGAADVVARVAKMRRTLRAEGEANVPISVTEVGWPTRGARRAIPDAERAQRLQLVVRRLAASNCEVAHFLPHTWTTPEADPNDPQHWFGIFRPEGRPTATSRGYRRAIERASRPRARARRTC